MTTHPHLTEPSLTAPRIVRCHVIDVSFGRTNQKGTS